ncbi:MAG: hypothetical protein DHS20C18_04280 [Saprospiraceae bacterium]|nr:MAG: hypothetical protein DHS20C18_04280 [Saprospiraceae bacterium]
MPKTPSVKLFRLIKSLSGSEKRYFKLYVNKDSTKDNKYLLLFDAIEAQEFFDEEGLKQLIYPDEPINSRKYSELKAYLYDLILRSLQFYDEKSSVDFRLKGMLSSIRVLYKRSHYEDCREIIGKGKKLARRYEKYNSILEFLDWEKQIAYAQTDIAYLDRNLNGIAAEETMVHTQIDYYLRSRNIFFNLLVNLRKDPSLSKASWEKKLADTIDPAFMEEVKAKGGHQARVIYYRTTAIYAYALRDFQQFYTLSKSLLELMESKRHFLQEDVSEYISAISNFIRSCGELSKYEEIELALNKLRNVTPKNQDDELKIHRQYYQSKFSLCIDQGTFEEGRKALQDHFEERKKFDPSYFENNSFYYNYFYIYFGAGDYQKALEFLNKWLGLAKDVERMDLQSLARMLNLIIHYELGNTVLLESLIRSTYRFLKKRNRLHDVERELIHFIREASEAYSGQDVRKALTGLKTSFNNLSHDPLSRNVITRYFNIIAWVESKIRKVTFAEIIQEEFEKHPSNGAQ